MIYGPSGLGGNFIFKFPFEKVARLQRVPSLSWQIYEGNFIKDPMGVWQGNELLAGLQKVSDL